MAKVLPACRRLLTDASSRLLSAQNYVILLGPFLYPAGFLILPFLYVVIVPKFREIFNEMLSSEFPALTQFVFAFRWPIVGLQVGIALAFLVGVVLYAAGPKLASAFGPTLNPLTDRLAYRFSWRRHRLPRDFSAVLAVLLDAELPEPQAVQLAASSTTNHRLIRRAEAAARDLEQGVPLTEAVRRLDDSGEFHWRLMNAVHSHGGFATALAGWHDSLEAKAYQQEQAAAQMISTALVVFNGLIVGLIVVGVFQCLIAIVQEGTMW